MANCESHLIPFQHQTSVVVLGILGLLAIIFEYSNAVPVAADPYHEEKLGRVKIQVNITSDKANIFFFIMWLYLHLFSGRG